MAEAKVAKIAVSAATYWLDKPYDYLIPESMQGKVTTGMRVIVPFSRGNRQSEGIVLGLSDHSDFGDKLKPVISVLDTEPALTLSQIKLALWMHDRLFCTVYDAVKAILPAGLWFKPDGSRRINDKTVEFVELAISAEEASELSQSKRHKAPQQASILELLCSTGRVPAQELLHFTGASRQSLKALINAGFVISEFEEVFRRPEVWNGEIQLIPELNSDQQNAFEGLSELLSSDRPQAALLFGVTGSGKTAVYIHLIDKVLNEGKTAILLVPEIALTPQMIRTFSSYFGNSVAVLHSSLSIGERYDEWKRVKSGSARLVIGTRSAIFAPCENLGLIIIDEEQEDSYKSENSPRYHARDIAKYLCAKSNSLLLLGSATPDLESRYSAQIGRYKFFTLSKRYNKMLLPTVKIVDMKGELKSGNGGNISAELRDELAENIVRGEQSILFLNRRGANKLICCGDCGFIYKCPNCSVSLTYHSSNKRLMCHYCGYKAAGTHEALLEKFDTGKIPIMIGTQMVTKGLNFENVTLIGVLSADQSLYCGDYRSGERTFSLITQVVGRSGRGSKVGRAIIQTYTPDNEIIKLAAMQDYESFYESEIQLRRLQMTPPFADIIAITASGQDENAVLRCCTDIRSTLRASIKDEYAKILGPAPLAVVKVNNRYRYRVSISCKIDTEIRSVVSAILIKFNSSGKYKGVSIFADSNPSD